MSKRIEIRQSKKIRFCADCHEQINVTDFYVHNIMFPSEHPEGEWLNGTLCVDCFEKKVGTFCAFCYINGVAV